MRLTTINVVYFSATNTTQKVVRTVAGQFAGTIQEYNITKSVPEKEVILEDDELFIVGMPVYAGRIPAIAAQKLQNFKSTGAPAIIVCVYGNRDYDDALLELKDIVEENGFKVVSAAAFVAQHSIFPKVAHNRPDEKDLFQIKEFALQTAGFLKLATDITAFSNFEVKGNRPYKIAGKIPLKPKTNRKCNGCGTCIKQCPVKAIPADDPRKTDKDICISCARCITVCPQKARSFGGLLYKVASSKFTKANAERKESAINYSLIN